MAFNQNELILDRVRSLTAHDMSNGEMLFRLTSLEDPSLNCTAEGEEVTDAIGALITTLYRAKKASFSASNSLLSLDLAAAQFGTKKEIASDNNKIAVPVCETCTVKSDGTIELSNTPSNEIRFVYKLVDGGIATRYTQTAFVDETDVEETDMEIFSIDGKVISLPLSLAKDDGGVVEGNKILVEYEFESTSANRIVNKTSEFPEACTMKIYAYFRDKCNENLVYSGVIVAKKAKLNPESVELALTSTGKHAFEFQMMRDYCDEEAELFSIIVAE